MTSVSDTCLLGLDTVKEKEETHLKLKTQNISAESWLVNVNLPWKDNCAEQYWTSICNLVFRRVLAITSFMLRGSLVLNYFLLDVHKNYLSFPFCFLCFIRFSSCPQCFERKRCQDPECTTGSSLPWSASLPYPDMPSDPCARDSGPGT